VLSADTGITPLVNGQSYIDVVFDVPRSSNDWVFVELRVLNTVDANALNIRDGIITNKTVTGFRLQLDGIPDTNNYYLQWTINEITTAPGPATTYVISGPATGAPGIPATFTVHLPSHTTVAGSVIVTPSDGGAGGAFTPTSVGLTTAAPSATFTYMAVSAGAKTISATNNGGLIDPASLTFTAAYATTYTLSGPSSGDVGAASTNFTVALVAGTSVPAPVTVTPSAGAGGGTFTPTTVNLTTGAPSATFTYMPASVGTKTVAVTNSGGLTDPTSLTYTALSNLHLLNTLVSYWKLDEAGSTTRNDSVGTNHLTDHGGVGGLAAKINNGGYFSAGALQYLSRASNASLQVTGDFTFSLWVRVDDQHDSFLISKDDGINRDYSIGYGATSGFAILIGGINAVSVGASATTYGWYHLVAWFDSSDNKCRLRVNDTTTYVASATSTLVQTAVQFCLGASSFPSGYFTGLIDEVGFWKRKLNAGEITALYNGGSGLPFSSFTT
jgi:hypothetical protein